MKIRKRGPFTLTTRGAYCALELDIHLPHDYVFTIQVGTLKELLALELWSGVWNVSHRLVWKERP